MILDTELWAWEGCVRTSTANTASIASQAETATEFTPALVESLLRAAYGCGYSHALSDTAPLSYAEAMKRRDELALLLPVA